MARTDAEIFCIIRRISSILSQRLNDEAEIDIMIDQNKTEVATRCLSQPLFLFQIKLSKYAEAIGIVHVFFSSAGVSGEPNTNCERSFQFEGIFHSFATASSITGL